MGVPPVILVDVRLDAYVTDGLGTTSQKSRKAEATNSLRARKPSTISRQILVQRPIVTGDVRDCTNPSSKLDKPG
jgi:hypothetical protein